jgi:hypothetical protein
MGSRNPSRRLGRPRTRRELSRVYLRIAFFCRPALSIAAHCQSLSLNQLRLLSGTSTLRKELDMYAYSRVSGAILSACQGKGTYLTKLCG